MIYLYLINCIVIIWWIARLTKKNHMLLNENTKWRLLLMESEKHKQDLMMDSLRICAEAENLKNIYKNKITEV